MENFKFYMTEVVLMIADMVGAEFWRDGVARTLSNPYRSEALTLAVEQMREETAGASDTVSIGGGVVEVSEQKPCDGGTVDSLTFEQDTTSTSIDILPVPETQESGGVEILHGKASITERGRARIRPYSKKISPSKPTSIEKDRGDHSGFVLSTSPVPGRWRALSFDSNGRSILSTTQKNQATAVRKR